MSAEGTVITSMLQMETVKARKLRCRSHGWEEVALGLKSSSLTSGIKFVNTLPSVIIKYSKDI